MIALIQNGHIRRRENVAKGGQIPRELHYALLDIVHTVIGRLCGTYDGDRVDIATNAQGTAILQIS